MKRGARRDGRAFGLALTFGLLLPPFASDFAEDDDVRG
jgi:hypothetical protein